MSYDFDLHRIVFGDLPMAFFAELAVRSAFMFLFALTLLRLTGKRSLGQLSPFDFVIIIALGSAVGDPMLYEDVPVGHAIVVVVVVVALNTLISRVTQRHRTAEKLTDSTASILVRAGTVNEDALVREGLSIVELGEALRLNGVTRLDEVQLAVLEPSGAVSVLRVDNADEADLWARFLDERADDRWG